MRKRIQVALWMFICLILWMSQTSFATTNAKQSFTFLALIRCGPDFVFWIAEDIDIGEGEKGTSCLIQVIISNLKVTTISTDLKNYKDWTWFNEGIKHLSTEPVLELKEKDGRWSTGIGAEWALKAPPVDPRMLRRWERKVSENISSAEEWNEEYGRRGLMRPLVEEWLFVTRPPSRRPKTAKTEFIYYYPAGLYINYKIDKVYYFPRSGYILVFTHQPVSAVGLNTQHGFLILKRVES